MRKWNWSIFWVMLLCGVIGAVYNRQTPLHIILPIGIVFGGGFGFLLAWLTKEQETTNRK